MHNVSWNNTIPLPKLGRDCWLVIDDKVKVGRLDLNLKPDYSFWDIGRRYNRLPINRVKKWAYVDYPEVPKD